jgi:hypothetical protein
VEDFSANDSDISRCLNPDADLLTADLQDPDSDAQFRDHNFQTSMCDFLSERNRRNALARLPAALRNRVSGGTNLL